MLLRKENKHKLKRLLIGLKVWWFFEPIYQRLIKPKPRKQLLKLYSQFIKPGDLCFDVGANIGNYTEVLLNLGAKVIAIEPQPKCIKYLKKRFKNNFQVEIIEKGLADKEGELKLHICEEALSTSTFLEEWEIKQKGYEWNKGYKWNKEKIVPVTTLDNLIEEFGLPDYCKIDVEGYEGKVLKGLTKHIPIISFEAAGEVKEDAENNIKYLASLGYKDFKKIEGDIFAK